MSAPLLDAWKSLWVVHRVLTESQGIALHSEKLPPGSSRDATLPVTSCYMHRSLRHPSIVSSIRASQRPPWALDHLVSPTQALCFLATKHGPFVKGQGRAWEVADRGKGPVPHFAVSNLGCLSEGRIVGPGTLLRVGP